MVPMRGIVAGDTDTVSAMTRLETAIVSEAESKAASGQTAALLVIGAYKRGQP
jgi:hypothetical protein